MSSSIMLRGADVKVYIAGKLFPEIENLSYAISYGEQEIYGIDSPFPQEIAPTKVSVQGTVNGIVIRNSGGLQAKDCRSKIDQILYAKYVSLQILDRQTDKMIFYVPQMKVMSEQVNFSTKGVVRFSFSFKGIIPYNVLDIYK